MPPAGEADPSNRENGLRRVGYALASSVGTGGTAEGPLRLKAFLMLARDPFRLARKPGVEPIEVPAVTMEDCEPFENCPTLPRLLGAGTSCP